MAAGGEVSIEVRDGQGFTEIVFRRTGALGRLAMLVLVILGWLFGLMFGVVMLAATEQRAFMALWLGGWSLGGLFMIWVVIWRALGVESLIARSDGLTVMRRLAVLRFGQTVTAQAFRTLHWRPDDPTRRVVVNGRRLRQPHLEVVAAERVLRLAHGITSADADRAKTLVQRRVVLAKRRAA